MLCCCVSWSGTCSNTPPSAGRCCSSAGEEKWPGYPVSTRIGSAAVVSLCPASWGRLPAYFMRHAGRGGSGLWRVISAAGVRRCLSWVHQHYTGTVQCVGFSHCRLLLGGGHHRAGVHGRQQLRARHVLWWSTGPGGDPVAIGPRPRGTAILKKRSHHVRQTVLAIWSAMAARRLIRDGRTAHGWR